MANVLKESGITLAIFFSPYFYGDGDCKGVRITPS